MVFLNFIQCCLTPKMYFNMLHNFNLKVYYAMNSNKEMMECWSVMFSFFNLRTP